MAMHRGPRALLVVVVAMALGGMAVLAYTAPGASGDEHEPDPSATPEATPTPTPTPTPKPLVPRALVANATSYGVLEVSPETGPTLETCTREPDPLWFTYTPWSNPAASPYRSWVERSVAQYIDLGVDHERLLAPYETGGDFLNWGAFRVYNEGGELRFDERGVPMINVNGDGRYYYHPTTIAQYALALHGRWLRDTGELDDFLEVVDALVEMQDWRGAFRIEFAFPYYRSGKDFPPGWTSSLTQAQAMSALARAWLATGDERYREAGDRALAFMVTPANQGGTLSSLAGVNSRLADYVFFKTFPGVPTAFTLNGLMLTMLGIYDWWQIDPDATSGASAEAGEWFECAAATLHLVLPLYDLGGFSAYDLGHFLLGGDPNAQVAYHAIHIGALHALTSVTGNPRLQAVEDRWRTYVEGDAP